MRLIDADAIEYTHAIARSLDDGHNWNELCVTKDEIEDMSTIQPEPHWHPASEMPEEDDDYLLLTHEKTKYGTFKRIIIGAWNGATKEWLEEYEGMYRDVNHPVAWISKEELLLLKGCEVTT